MRDGRVMPAPLGAGAPAWRRIARGPWLGPAVALLGAAALVVAGMLPIWGTRLVAPQYPKGLDIWFYGGRADGPLREVNGLNHYIGMRQIDLAAVPELALWPLAVVGSALLLALAALVPGRLGRLALLGLWLVPVAILADIQRWLVVYGTQLDPKSALRLDPFVPLVIGPSTVWNFTIWTYPGPALILIWVVAGAALVARRLPRTRPRAALAAGIAALALTAVGTVVVVMPTVRPTVAAAVSVGPTPARGPVDLPALIAAAPAGGTVVVPAGAYRVHLVIDRPLTLVAGGDVLLDGGGRGTVVTVGAPNVTIRGFRIAGTGGQVEEAAGIKVIDADGVSIEGNRIEEAFSAISVVGGSGVRIVGNEIVGRGQVVAPAEHARGSAGAAPAAPLGGASAASGHESHGQGAGPAGQGDAIALWNVRGALVRDNRIRDVRDGIYLNFADQVLVDGNTVERSRYALHAMSGSTLTVFGNDLRHNLSGLVFMYMADVLAGRNTITDARSTGTGFGVVVKDVRGFRFAENLVARNRVGLQVEGTVHGLDDEAVVLSNRIVANDVGVALMDTADLVFGGNVFDANLDHVRSFGPSVAGRNVWSHAGIGNTWSDYAGYDLAGDGVGDVPYRSSGSAHLLVAAEPALQAYATSPALAVLAVARGVWEGRLPPVVVDQSPRTEQVGAQAAPELVTEPRPPALWWLGGSVLIAAAGVGLAIVRRPAAGAVGWSADPAPTASEARR